jgi:hypothetical protein
MRLVLSSRSNANVYAHWVAARHGRSMPRIEDIDVGKITDKLSYVYFAEVMHDEAGMWFKFRLVGGLLVDQIRQQGTGRMLLELQIGGWEEEWRKNLVYAVKMKMPVVDESTIKTEAGLQLDLEHLALPLSEDGEHVTRIFGAIDFTEMSEADLLKILPEFDWKSVSSIELEKRILISNLRIQI